MKQPLTNPYHFLEGLKKQNKKFKIKKTMFTMEIECDFGEFKWISKESNLPKHELYFIKMVKEDVKTFDLNLIEKINVDEIKYFNLPEKDFCFENCFEIDISSAYWNIARKFLSDKVYLRGLTVDKKTRLSALGGLAKTTTEMFFDGKEFGNIHTETEPTKDLFFYCARETGEIMDKIRMVCDSALFFWVDAVFVKSEKDLQYIFALLELNNLTGKIYKCEKIISEKEKMIVYSSEHKKARREFLKERKTSNFFIGRFKNNLFA